MNKASRYALSQQQHLLVQWVILGLALLVISLLIGISLVEEYYNIGDLERDRLSTQARVINRTIGQHLDAVNRGLQLVREELPEWRVLGWGEVNHRLRALDDAMPGIRTILVTDAQGTVLAADREELPGKNFSYRGYFDMPRRQPDPKTLYISPPFKTLIGVLGMNATLIIPGPHGEFNGIISATLDPSYFSSILSSVLYAPDMRSSIVHGDGLQFLMIPQLEGLAIKNMAVPGSFFSRHRESGKTENVLTGVSFSTGEKLMMALSTVKSSNVTMNKPLIITVSRHMDALYAKWRLDVKVQGALFGLMGITGILGLYFYQRRLETYDRQAAESITALRGSEEKLRSNERLLQTVFDTEPECVKLIDAKGNLIMMNRAGLDMIEAESLEQVRGQCVCPIVSPAHRPAFEKMIENVFKGNSEILTFEMIGLKGRRLWLESHSVPFRDDKGDIIALLGITRDITEKKNMEEQLLRAQKLESIGVLAGGIAHDFNNLLQGVFGYMSMARVNLDNKERANALLHQAEKALNMSVNLTSQLLTFAKGGRPVKKRIAIQSIIENAASFALSGAKSDYRITADEKLWHVDADEGQIWQVVQNIVFNASEAMPDGGTIEVSADNVCMPSGRNPLLPDGGKFVVIAIKDFGIGIPVAHQLRIFDPYFTTKQRGSGLGLATAYSIVRNHGGLIDLKSEVNKGSTFSIYLPAVDVEVMPETQQSSPGSVRSIRILLMDDEVFIRDVAGQMIKTLGHEVTCAENGEDAIEKFMQAKLSGSPFDVVILDLTVKGGMGGEQTIKKLLELDPNVKAIVSSGYSENQVISDFKSFGFAAYLNKPYNLEDLMESLHSIIC